MPNGILSGLRVIDCGTYVAGPASTTIMSDFGAEVVKIERPQGGDLYRSMADLPGFAKADLNWAWILTSRNKKSVALDLSSPRGWEVLIRLVKTAEVPADLGASPAGERAARLCASDRLRRHG
jgi:crotonobetainyl-CoA:carnitine CoA-transferase CaiB-like acyl-CoA transferase